MSSDDGIVVGEELAPVRIALGGRSRADLAAIDTGASIFFGQELAPVGITLNTARHSSNLDCVLVRYELTPVWIGIRTCANRLSVDRHYEPGQHRRDHHQF